MRIFADGRGRNKKAIAEKNYLIVKQWMTQNKEKTITECAQEVGLSYKTVMKHARRFSEEAETDEHRY